MVHADVVLLGVQTEDEIVHVNVVSDDLRAGVLSVVKMMANGRLQQEGAADHTKGYTAKAVHCEVVVQRCRFRGILVPQKACGVVIRRVKSNLQKGLLNVSEKDNR